MKVEITFRYDITDSDPEIERLGTELMEDEARALLARLHRRFAEAGLEVERFESSREST